MNILMDNAVFIQYYDAIILMINDDMNMSIESISKSHHWLTCGVSHPFVCKVAIKGSITITLSTSSVYKVVANV